MEGTFANKQIGNRLVCTIGGEDACSGRYEIKDRPYVAVGDFSRMYRIAQGYEKYEADTKFVHSFRRLSYDRPVACS